MSEHPNRLALTGAEALDPRSFEIVRLWVTDGGGSTAWIANHVLADPAAFGRLASDLIRHGASAYSQNGERTASEALSAIMQGFDAAMAQAAEMSPLDGKAN